MHSQAMSCGNALRHWEITRFDGSGDRRNRFDHKPAGASHRMLSMSSGAKRCPSHVPTTMAEALCVTIAHADKPAIAQLVEHLTVECCSYQMVPGSIPGGRILSAHPGNYELSLRIASSIRNGWNRPGASSKFYLRYHGNAGHESAATETRRQATSNLGPEINSLFSLVGRAPA